MICCVLDRTLHYIIDNVKPHPRSLGLAFSLGSPPSLGLARLGGDRLPLFCVVLEAVRRPQRRLEEALRLIEPAERRLAAEASAVRLRSPRRLFYVL